ncbi:calmodulin-binding transcription activator 3-like [Tasmannia lanceolata]|uniref:calmodulin-binding transcription activator 3-like n=1 Tax=Tasmannia lanceolata TaxID=3420 RepID=UPI0040628553
MAESRIYGLKPLDIEQILAEAQNRWLRPSEVIEILRNYQRFCLAPDPPYKPPGGSLFLFDRKALRYFRKDGHCWRKKKDGKTVREADRSLFSRTAHEKLKAGSVDALHCYYAHGEDNENFQRRCYWMLDGQLEHIVLVHYREVKEGNRSGISRLLNADPGTQNHSGSAQHSSAACSAQANSPANSHSVAARTFYESSPSTTDWNGRTPFSEFEDVDSGPSSFATSFSGIHIYIYFLHGNDRADKHVLGCRGTTLQRHARGSSDVTGVNIGSVNPFYANQVVPLNLIAKGYQADCGASQEAGLFGGMNFSPSAGLPMWSDVLSSNRNVTSMHKQKISLEQPNTSDVKSEKQTDSTLDIRYNVLSDTHVQTVVGDAQKLVQGHWKVENVEHVDYFHGHNQTMNAADDMHQVSYENKLCLVDHVPRLAGRSTSTPCLCLIFCNIEERRELERRASM